MDVLGLISQTANQYGVDPSLALAVAQQESGLNQSARGSKGEVGVFQLMPGTAASLGVDPYSLSDNIRGGIMYLKQQLDRFGNVSDALAAYNAGPGNVAKGVIPGSTVQYVESILNRLGGLIPTFSTTVYSTANDFSLDASPVYGGSLNWVIIGVAIVGAFALWKFVRE